MRLRIVLDERHAPTGITRHARDGRNLNSPTALEIVSETSGSFLYYLDSAGQPQTDTWHASLDDALAQAESEFGVTFDEWERFET